MEKNWLKKPKILSWVKEWEENRSISKSRSWFSFKKRITTEIFLEKLNLENTEEKLSKILKNSKNSKELTTKEINIKINTVYEEEKNEDIILRW